MKVSSESVYKTKKVFSTGIGGVEVFGHVLRVTEKRWGFFPGHHYLAVLFYKHPDGADEVFFAHRTRSYVESVVLVHTVPCSVEAMIDLLVQDREREGHE